ncbi:MAG: transcription termination/antitermination protein NusG [Armatimonadetes bacterium]|jgi:transcriptional antiterminator NusG|nr:transcription termination/antitermination protein NusG [Armatimonadota bacterium]
MTGQRHWYAVHTYSGHENKVMTNILRQAEARSLRSKIYDIRIPTEVEVRTRAGKRTEVKRKVFPGYVLIDMVLDEDTWYLVKSTTGVTGFVSSGNRPVPLQEREVQAILQTEAGAVQRPRVQWSKDDVIRVISGPFADFTGKIEDVNIDKEKLRVFISIFGRETPVELDFTQVEKA